MALRIRHTAPRMAPLKASGLTDLVLFLLLVLVVIGVHPLEPAGRAMLTGDGDLGRQIAYLLLFSGSVFVFASVQDLRRLAPIPVTVLLLLAWCWLSVFWSVAPAITLRRLALTTILVWMVFVAVDRAGFQRTLAIMRLVLLAALILNYLAVIATPYGVHQAGDRVDPGLIGNWRGFALHKNQAGAICAATILSFVFIRDGIAAKWRFVVVAIAAYFLYRTMSKTSMGLLGLGLICGWVFMLIDPRRRPLLIPVAVLAALVLVYAGVSYLSGYVSPDTLTGRVQIWPVLIEYARTHPWLGSGFGAVWGVGADSPALQYTRSWVADISTGHSGYLDILTQLGVPGLVLALVALVVKPGWQILTNIKISGSQGAFLVAWLLFCAGHNLMESDMLSRDGFVGVMQLFAVALIRQTARQQMSVGRPGPAVPHRHAYCSQPQPVDRIQRQPQ